MKKISIAVIMTVFSLIFLSSCATMQSGSTNKYGPDDPSSKIIIEEDLAQRELVDGYRVKVASADTEDEAQILEKQIVEAVHEPVYIEFIVDKYMIYAGDCRNKEEANILKEKLKEAGFTKIYSVPKKVYKNDFEEAPSVVDTDDTPSYGEEDLSPAVKPIDDFNKIIGYRVQLIAARNEDNAKKVKSEAYKTIDERIYIVKADNLYKVQVGDFLSKIDAEKLRDELRKNPAYSDAFIQKSYVLVDKSSLTDGDFYVQVGAFSSQSLAEDFINSSLPGYMNTSVYGDNGLYKVLVGSFATKDEARIAQQKLTAEGFEGAWIIKK